MRDQDFIQVSQNLWAVSFTNSEGRTVIQVCQKVSDNPITNPDMQTNLSRVETYYATDGADDIAEDLSWNGFKAESYEAAKNIREKFGV